MTKFQFKGTFDWSYFRSKLSNDTMTFLYKSYDITQNVWVVMDSKVDIDLRWTHGKNGIWRF